MGLCSCLILLGHAGRAGAGGFICSGEGQNAGAMLRPGRRRSVLRLLENNATLSGMAWPLWTAGSPTGFFMPAWAETWLHMGNLRSFLVLKPFFRYDRG